MLDRFQRLADALFTHLEPDERLLLGLHGERSDFVRYNRGGVRQVGNVESATLELRLVVDGRHATHDLLLGHDDLARATTALKSLRALLPSVPQDPHLHLPTERVDSERRESGDLDAHAISASFLEGVRGLDAVGLLTCGPVFHAFADSTGQRNVFERSSFHLDWSIFEGGRATKLGAAGLAWDPALLDAQMARFHANRELLAAPEIPLEPGTWRAYLAPAAVSALLGVLSYSGFGKRAWERGYGCLARALDGEPLSPLLTIDERTHDGLGAPFDALGFTRPDSVRLFEGGRPVEPLVSARSAREFDVPGNGASDWEHPQSLYVHGGDLPEEEVLEALGDGLWVSDLHYLNFSDHGAGSVTGLTRFACFRVEGGRITGPIPVMRFDDSAFSLLGTSLERLTDTPRLHPETRSYDGRSSRSVRCPGALVGGLRLTL